MRTQKGATVTSKAALDRCLQTIQSLRDVNLVLEEALSFLLASAEDRVDIKEDLKEMEAGPDRDAFIKRRVRNFLDGCAHARTALRQSMKVRTEKR